MVAPVADEVGAVKADLHDETVFANQIRHDAFGSTPGNQLLTALRGKDVLLVFVESYGKVSVQGSSFSPAIDALLDEGLVPLILTADQPWESQLNNWSWLGADLAVALPAEHTIG